MKKSINYIALLAIVWLTALTSCKKEDIVSLVPNVLSADAIQGTWKITISQGTEWEKTLGIVTPKANEPDLLNGTLKFIPPSEVQIRTSNGTLMGATGFTVDALDLTIEIDGIGLFNVKNYVAGKSMNLEQVEPTKDSDYKFNSQGNNYLYFQKFWTTVKQ
jgi:hypothetical protein